MANEGKVQCPTMVNFNRRCIRMEGHMGPCDGGLDRPGWSLRVWILSRDIPIVGGIRRTRPMPCRKMRQFHDRPPSEIH